MADNWRFVRIQDLPSGRVRIVTSFLRIPVDKLMLRGARLPEATNTNDMNRDEAIEIGQKLEDWIASQNEGRKSRR